MSETLTAPSKIDFVLKTWSSSVTDFIGVGNACEAPPGVSPMEYFRTTDVKTATMVTNLGPSPILASPIGNQTPDSNGHITQGVTIQPGLSCIWFNQPPENPNKCTVFAIGGDAQVDVTYGFIREPTANAINDIRTQSFLPPLNFAGEVVTQTLGTHIDLTPTGTIDPGADPTIR